MAWTSRRPNHPTAGISCLRPISIISWRPTDRARLRLARPGRQGHGRYGKPVGCEWRGASDKSPPLAAPEEEHGHQPERDLSELSVVARVLGRRHHFDIVAGLTEIPAGAPGERGTMPVPMSGRRANFPGSTPVVNALGPRQNDVEVPPPTPLHRLRVATRLLTQGGQRTPSVGVWDPVSSFLQAASVSLVGSVSAHGALPQQGVSLLRLKTRRFTECGLARPHGA
jgi:hypothetical protein